MIDGALANATLKALTPFGVKGILSRINKLKQDFKTRSDLQIYYSHIKSPSKPDTVLKNIEEKYLKIRTLAFPEKLVSIKDIYHPLKVNFLDRGVTHSVDDEQMFFLDKLAIVVGVAGQGKTTTLRKLIHKELHKGEEGKIPIMISMREIDWNENEITLSKIISRELRQIGIVINHEAIEVCMVKKAFLLCFDGFDEVPLDQRNNALRMLMKGYSYTKNPMIVTSRPNTEITVEMGHTEIVKLENLDSDDVVKIISKNKNLDDSYKALLTKSYEENKEIKGVIITPILVDIFTVVYGRVQITPKNIVEFYEELYYGLTDKHDRFKQLERDKKCSLNNASLLNVLIRVSFQFSLSQDSYSFSPTKGIEVFKASLDKLDYKDEPISVLQDVVDRTSLIINDGDQYSFLHKSIMEFYSAKFIATRTIDTKKRIYKHISDNYSYKFENILRFLKELDSYDFYELFVIYQIQASQITELFELDTIQKKVAEFMNFPLSITCEKSGEFKNLLAVEYTGSNGLSNPARLGSVFQVLDLYEHIRIPSVINSIQDNIVSNSSSFLDRLVRDKKCIYSESDMTEEIIGSYFDDVDFKSNYDFIVDDSYICIGKADAVSMNKSIKHELNKLYEKNLQLKAEKEKENDISYLLGLG